jgi:EpsI family protein
MGSELIMQATNKSQRRDAFIALVLALVVVLGAYLLTPRHKMAEINKDLKLAEIIPESFGGWQLDRVAFSAVVNPQQKELLDALYSQTLSRTYINSVGQRVMLSIAYGESQAGGLELHRPEVCYVAQGFSLEKAGSSLINLPPQGESITIQHLIAWTGPRREPISYWMRVGDDVVPSGTPQQISRVRQGFMGWIPDGLLFRVSTISEDKDKDAAYRIQAEFVSELFSAISPAGRRFLIGPVTSGQMAGG